ELKLNIKMIKILKYSLVFFYSLMLSGQSAVKKNITPKEYGLWHTLTYLKFSSDGNWASYRLNYQGTHDTLFVKNTRNDITYSFPKGNQRKFTHNGNYFLAELTNKRLCALNLADGQKNWYDNVISYQISGPGEHIGILQDKDEGSCLRLITLSSRAE